MLYLSVHDDAQRDLDELWKADPSAAARLVVLLQELQGSQDLQDRLTQNGFGTEGRDKFNVRSIVSQVHAGHNLWRLKEWQLERMGRQYRIIYAFIPTKRHHHILGIMPREIDYDRDHEFFRRVELAYDALREGRW
jgi:hypothetical protein